MVNSANLLLEDCLQQHHNSLYEGFYKEKNEKHIHNCKEKNSGYKELNY